LYEFENVFDLNLKFEFKFKSTVKKFENLYLFSQATQIIFGPFFPGSPAIMVILFHFPGPIGSTAPDHSALRPTSPINHSGLSSPSSRRCHLLVLYRHPQAPVLPCLPIPEPSPPFPLTPGVIPLLKPLKPKNFIKHSPATTLLL
jgi:hypothetical protein